MATFTYQGRQVYYEEHGNCSPLLVLNGIFMSCASWRAFVPSFARQNRLLLLDLLDQGRTEKMDCEYTQAEQVELVRAFIEHTGFEQVDLMGISYGGEVAMQFAAKYPGMVNKLVLSNTTAYTGPWLRDIGHSWEYAYKSGDGHQFFKTCIPIIYAPKFYEDNYAWASAREQMFVDAFGPAVYAAFGRLTRSAEGHDARAVLKDITAPTLVISSDQDYVTPPARQAELVAGIANAAHITIMGAGHAVMYEKPVEFASVVLGFINMNTEINTLT